MNRDKIIYWIATGIMCLIFTGSAMMYFFNYEMAASIFDQLGFPRWLVYPSAVLKLLGVTAILTQKSAMLKEWAYAGFFFDVAIAFTAHTIVQDGGGMPSLIALIMVVVSRFFETRGRGRSLVQQV
jgi:hypothetical protein